MMDQRYLFGIRQGHVKSEECGKVDSHIFHSNITEKKSTVL